MKISKIEKKKRLYLLEIDGQDKLYVTEDTLVRFMLSKDKEISPELLEEIKEFAQVSYGKNLALYHLSFKLRSSKEVEDYLRKHEIEESLIPRIIQTLKEDAWIDDKKLALALLESNSLNGDKGSFFLQRKLMEKGLSKKLIEEVLESQDFQEVADRTAAKLARRYESKLPHKALKDKILQQLMQKGFSYQQAKIAFEGLEVEEDPENQMDLLYQDLDKLQRKYQKKYQGYDLKQRLTQALARKGYDFSDIASALREVLD